MNIGEPTILLARWYRTFLARIVRRTRREFRELQANFGSDELIEEAVRACARRTEHLYIIQITLCTYILVTIASIRDIDFFTNAVATLPLINTKVPLDLFFLAAPLTTLSVFMYFQLNLGLLQRLMLTGGNALHIGRSTGWLILLTFNRTSGYVDAIRLLTALIAWGLVPTTVFFAWLRVAPFHWNLPTQVGAGGKVPDLPPYDFVTLLSIASLVTIVIWWFARRFTQLVITKASRAKPKGWLPTFASLLIVAVVASHFVIGASINDFYRIQLQGAQLPNFTLDNANFRRANLFGANLSGARLNNAHLEEAILSSANLEGAVLVDAHLEGASMRFVNLRNASLVGAHLEGAYLLDSHLDGAYMVNVNLRGADLTTAFLIGADLTRMNPQRYQTQTRAADGAHLEGAILYGAHLEGAILNSAHLDGADLSEAHLEGAVLDYASVKGANLEGASCRGCSASGLVVGTLDKEQLLRPLVDDKDRLNLRLSDGVNLFDVLTRRLGERDSKGTSGLPLEGMCSDTPSQSDTPRRCTEVRKRALIEAVSGGGEWTDVQVAAIKEAWCLDGVRRHFKAWHGLNEKTLGEFPCAEVQWDGLEE